MSQQNQTKSTETESTQIKQLNCADLSIRTTSSTDNQNLCELDPQKFGPIVQKYFSAVKSLEDIYETRKTIQDYSKATTDFEKMIHSTRVQNNQNNQYEMINYYLLVVIVGIALLLVVVFFQKRGDFTYDMSKIKIGISLIVGSIIIYITSWYIFISEKNREYSGQ
jgi:hypothetical protein